MSVVSVVKWRRIEFFQIYPFLSIAWKIHAWKLNWELKLGSVSARFSFPFGFINRRHAQNDVSCPTRPAPSTLLALFVRTIFVFVVVFEPFSVDFNVFPYPIVGRLSLSQRRVSSTWFFVSGVQFIVPFCCPFFIYSRVFVRSWIVSSLALQLINIQRAPRIHRPNRLCCVFHSNWPLNCCSWRSLRPFAPIRFDSVGDCGHGRRGSEVLHWSIDSISPTCVVRKLFARTRLSPPIATFATPKTRKHYETKRIVEASVGAIGSVCWSVAGRWQRYARPCSRHVDKAATHRRGWSVPLSDSAQSRVGPRIVRPYR